MKFKNYNIIALVFLALFSLNRSCKVRKLQRVNNNIIFEYSNINDSLYRVNDSLAMCIDGIDFRFRELNNNIVFRIDSFITELDRSKQAMEIQRFTRSLKK